MDCKEIQNITSFFQVYATDMVLSDTKKQLPRVGNKFRHHHNQSLLFRAWLLCRSILNNTQINDVHGIVLGTLLMSNCEDKSCLDYSRSAHGSYNSSSGVGGYKSSKQSLIRHYRPVNMLYI